MSKLLTAAWLIGLLANLAAPLDAAAQQESRRPRRPDPPARDPHAPGFVSARELPDVFTYDPAIPSVSAGGHSCCVDTITMMSLSPSPGA